MERSNQRVASLADTSWSSEKIIFLRGSDGIEYTTRILPQKNELLMKGDYYTHTRNYRIDNNVFLRGRDQIMF